VDLVVRAVIVGVVQGLTEFIPVSSSAHLELTPWLLGWEPDGLLGSLGFDVFVHLGTLLALLAYFARDWIGYLGALLASLRERRIGDDPQRRLAWLLVLATVPGAAIGFLLEDLIEQGLHGDSSATRLAIAAFLLVGAAALWLADRYGGGRREMPALGARGALLIGLSQAAALLPGISRSGATISAGLALGLTRESAARFSFLLATPITAGAGLYGSRGLLTEPHSGVEWLAIAGGFAAAAVAGGLAIGFLLAWLRHRSVAVFSLYRVVLALVVIGLVLAGR
jgi:undecaprenyl-diphosphatase